MSTTSLILFIYISLFWIYEVTATYYVQDVDETSQVPRCTLATPEKSPSSTGGYSLQLPANLDIPDKEPVRVGYIQTSYNFLYKGCVSYDKWHPANMTMTQKDLGTCYTTCKTKYIGVSDFDCYCIRTIENINTNRQLCNYTCDRPRGAFCGGLTRGRVYISLYENVIIEDTRGSSSGKCLTFSPKLFAMAWRDCRQPLDGLCNYCFGNVPPIHVSRQRSWPEFVLSCLKYGCLPANPYVAYYDNQDYWWTLVVRRSYILNVRDPWMHVDYSYDGYVVKNGTNFDLLFATKNISRKFLCYTDDASELSTPYLPTSATQTTKDYAFSQSIITKGVNNVTSASSSRDTYQKPSDKGEPSNSAMIAVYVIVPIVLIALVVGAIFIVRIKRMKGNNTTSGPHTHHDNNETRGAVINAAFDEHCVPTDPVVIQQHDYWVLEKSNDLADTSVDTSSFDSYFTEDSDYNLPEEQIDNVYANTDGNQSTPPDDTYNHLGQEVDIEGTYNITQRWNNLKDNNNATENTYDRVGSPQSDNVYNIAGTSEIDNDQMTRTAIHFDSSYETAYC